ncbi:hypothetical protein [Streptomyces sp. CRN 30]|nr:hypothetical protein [Streptomyces sp. CRN 30]
MRLGKALATGTAQERAPFRQEETPAEDRRLGHDTEEEAAAAEEAPAAS